MDNSQYYQDVKYFAETSAMPFSVMRAVEACSNKLRPDQRLRPWAFLNHGLGLLDTDTDLNAYMVAYGEMHYRKCRVAMQNFPFPDLISGIEIVDWGCGQGLASLAVIEMLREQGKAHLIEKITLIEPSPMALERAQINIEFARRGLAFEANAINSYLPSTDSDDVLHHLKFTCHFTLHLLSNILDINTINIAALSRLMAPHSNNVCYAICTGPVNANSWRFKHLQSKFAVKSTFCDLTSSAHGTIENGHTYSCRALTFSYTALSDSSSAEFENMVVDASVSNDYSNDAAWKKHISKEETHVYDLITKATIPNDKVFLRPNINGDCPDIFFLRPNVGCAFILVDKSLHPDALTISNLVSRIRFYQSNLMKKHAPSMFAHAIINPKIWVAVKMVIFCPNYPRAELLAEINKQESTTEENKKDTTAEPNYIIDQKALAYIRFICKDEIANNSLRASSILSINGNIFSPKYLQELSDVISHQWHPFDKNKPGEMLSHNQLPLSQSTPGKHQKIRGFVGSGKTHVLCHRAINAQARTASSVLILTFNITLRQYIKHRLDKVNKSFSWDKFFITNYHELFSSTAQNLGIKTDVINAPENVFDTCADRVPKYNAILIDEVQDYEESWLKIVMKYFLAPGGEFVLFSDEAQNVYKRELDNEHRTRTPIPGSWNTSLDREKRPHRAGNPQIHSLLYDFVSNFMPQSVIIPTPDLFSNNSEDAVECIEVDEIINPEKYGLWLENLTQICLQHFDKHSLDPARTAIIGSNIHTLRGIDYYYRHLRNAPTCTAFETHEEWHALKTHHYGHSSGFEEDLNALRRGHKMTFSMNKPVLHLSSIHSFKGWEADNIILLVDPKTSPETVYVGITRARNRILIIGIGQSEFTEFFTNHKNP